MDRDFLDETIEFWQPYTKEKLTREDAREIIQNTVALFKFLHELDRELNGNKRAKKRLKKNKVD